MYSVHNVLDDKQASNQARQANVKDLKRPWFFLTIAAFVLIQWYILLSYTFCRAFGAYILNIYEYLNKISKQISAN